MNIDYNQMFWIFVIGILVSALAFGIIMFIDLYEDEINENRKKKNKCKNCGVRDLCLDMRNAASRRNQDDFCIYKEND